MKGTIVWYGGIAAAIILASAYGLGGGPKALQSGPCAGYEMTEAECTTAVNEAEKAANLRERAHELEQEAARLREQAGN